MLSVRDPIHGFIRTDPLEGALLATAPLQRLRWVHQLGLTWMVYPGAEHSRFSHVLGAMDLAGRVYDALAAKSEGRLDPDPRSSQRRAVRVAALIHDVGHAPFSHSAEELFESGIDHEEMTRRLLFLTEVQEAFDRHGQGLSPETVARILAGTDAENPVLSQIVSGELDVDKMDYLLRDSLYCGVRYGSYDLERLLDTMIPLQDPETGTWGVGVEEGGVHALEALILARYYMFTQVYFNVTGKVLELHLNQWLQDTGVRWRADPAEFLAEDDITVLSRMRSSASVHARAVVERRHFGLAFETKEHLSPEDKERFEAFLPELHQELGSDELLVSNSAKDPHRMGQSRVLVRRLDGALEPMEKVSQFIRHLTRIERYRIYTAPHHREAVAQDLRERWNDLVTS